MNRYHYNKTTGVVGICRAQLRACPLGLPEDQHCNSKKEAYEAYANYMDSVQNPKLKKENIHVYEDEKILNYTSTDNNNISINVDANTEFVHGEMNITGHMTGIRMVKTVDKPYKEFVEYSDYGSMYDNDADEKLKEQLLDNVTVMQNVQSFFNIAKKVKAKRSQTFKDDVKLPRIPNSPNFNDLKEAKVIPEVEKALQEFKEKNGEILKQGNHIFYCTDTDTKFAFQVSYPKLYKQPQLTVLIPPMNTKNSEEYQKRIQDLANAIETVKMLKNNFNIRKH